MSELVIAIDGPAGAGKSTVAKRVADATGLPYLDTGAMYRCVALRVQRDGLDPADANRVGHIASTVAISLEGQRALLDGEDVSEAIRTHSISGIVSVIAAHSSVRDAMRQQQRQWIADHGGGVVEGRDIATVVFPNALLKVFLTASPRVRAQRRVDQVGGDVDEIAASIAQRDHLDSTRSDSPLRPADGAVIVDSSDSTIDDVVASIVRHFDAARGAVSPDRQDDKGVISG